ncbi:MAG: cyclic nucleotide-binding domain-containing protein [Candidatus Anammoxibacter sp.]
MAEENVRLLMGIKVLDKLEYDEFEIIDKIVFPSKFNADDVLLKEGSHATSMFFVVEGTLEVITKKSDGSEVLMTTLSHGESIGELALIAGFVRSATVRAKTDGLLLKLKHEDFRTLLDNHPKIGIKVLEAIANLLSIKLRKTSKDLTELMLPIT